MPRFVRIEAPSDESGRVASVARGVISPPSPRTMATKCLSLPGARTKSRSGMVLLWTVMSCQPDRADAMGAEATRLVVAVRALRDAPNAEKGAKLRELEQISCSSTKLCRLRASCIGGYRSHWTAVQDTWAAHREMAAPGGEEQVKRLLSEAERALRASRSQVTDCARLEAEVSHRFHL